MASVSSAQLPGGVGGPQAVGQELVVGESLLRNVGSGWAVWGLGALIQGFVLDWMLLESKGSLTGYLNTFIYGERQTSLEISSN